MEAAPVAAAAAAVEPNAAAVVGGQPCHLQLRHSCRCVRDRGWRHSRHALQENTGPGLLPTSLLLKVQGTIPTHPSHSHSVARADVRSAACGNLSCSLCKFNPVQPCGSSSLASR
jgi:hypothetical protein